MHYSFIFIFLLPCSLAFAQPQQFSLTTEPETVGFSAERLERLDAFLKKMVADGLAPNAVTFVARKGEVVHHRAFGFHDLEARQAVKKDDIFRIASQTKSVVTTGLMMLYEQGAFLLDDPVAKYIPAFEKPKILESYDEETLMYTTRPATKTLTIRHILTHTSGIPSGHPLEKRPEFTFPYLHSLEADVLEDVVHKIASRPLTHEPGEQFTYGLSIDIVARLIEVLSGQPLDEYLSEHIFEPLGMQDTHFYLPTEKADRLVELYSKASPEDELTVHKNQTFRTFPVAGAQTFFSGGAGLVSTVEDYANFCQMLLNGGSFNDRQLLSPATVELMTRNHIGELEVWDRKDGFGFSFQIVQADTDYANPAPPGSYTWGGKYCSEFTIDPKNELIMLVFTNVDPYAHYEEFLRKFRILVYQALVE